MQPLGFYLRCCSLWQGSTSCSELMQDARGGRPETQSCREAGGDLSWRKNAAQPGITATGLTRGKTARHNEHNTQTHPAEAAPATEPRVCPWGCWLQPWDFPQAPAPSAPARTELKLLSPCSAATIPQPGARTSHTGKRRVCLLSLC